MAAACGNGPATAALAAAAAATAAATDAADAAAAVGLARGAQLGWPDLLPQRTDPRDRVAAACGDGRATAAAAALAGGWAAEEEGAWG